MSHNIVDSTSKHQMPKNLHSRLPRWKKTLHRKANKSVVLAPVQAVPLIRTYSRRSGAKQSVGKADICYFHTKTQFAPSRFRQQYVIWPHNGAKLRCGM